MKGTRLTETPSPRSERRARPTLAELNGVADILARYDITQESIAEHIAAEQAAIAEGVLVPLTSVRRAPKSVRVIQGAP